MSPGSLGGFFLGISFYGGKTVQKFRFSIFSIKWSTFILPYYRLKSTVGLPYGSIEHFVVKTHIDTLTKVSSNRILTHLSHSFERGVVIPAHNRSDSSRGSLVFPSPFRLSETGDLDPIVIKGRNL